MIVIRAESLRGSECSFEFVCSTMQLFYMYIFSFDFALDHVDRPFAPAVILDRVRQDTQMGSRSWGLRGALAVLRQHLDQGSRPLCACSVPTTSSSVPLGFLPSFLEVVKVYLRGLLFFDRSRCSSMLGQLLLIVA